MSLPVWIGVAVIGSLGALARFHVDGMVQRLARSAFPFGTLVINVSGSFVLGLLTGAAVTGNAMTLAGTAAIGAFTTFSTWMLESQRLAEDGEIALAVRNVLLSLLLGIGAALLGWQLGAAL
jgi:fluoride exporter